MPMLARRLSWIDVAFLTVGATIGSGIFRVPSLTAERLQNPALVLTVWIFAGLVALLGVGLFAELSARRPVGGGQYAYLRDGVHPFVAFEFVWTALVVTKPTSMAAAAILFAGYAMQFFGIGGSAVPVAVCLLVFLTMLNCLGVRTCANVQNVVIALKIAGVLAIVIAGFFVSAHAAAAIAIKPILPMNSLAGVGAAYVLVTFAYNGWSDVTAMSAETRRSEWAIARGLFVGVVLVVALYVLTNAACIRALGMTALIATPTPASDVLRLAFGSAGERAMGILVMLSTLGLIYAKLLAIPRFAHAMAEDGMFFAVVSRVNSKTRAPVAAVLIQGLIATAFATSFGYEQLIAAGSAGVSLFAALSALALFRFRARDSYWSVGESPGYRLPGHPYTTLMFAASMLAVMIASVDSYPAVSGIVFAVGIAAIPLYLWWARKRASHIDSAAPKALKAQ